MSGADQTAAELKVRDSFRQFLYIFIFAGGAEILRSTELVQEPEAVLASGMLVIVPVLLLEP